MQLLGSYHDTAPAEEAAARAAGSAGSAAAAAAAAAAVGSSAAGAGAEAAGAVAAARSVGRVPTQDELGLVHGSTYVARLQQLCGSLKVCCWGRGQGAGGAGGTQEWQGLGAAHTLGCDLTLQPAAGAEHDQALV